MPPGETQCTPACLYRCLLTKVPRPSLLPCAESLNSLLNPEWMDGDNAYFCEHCQAKVRAL